MSNFNLFLINKYLTNLISLAIFNCYFFNEIEIKLIIELKEANLKKRDDSSLLFLVDPSSFK
jgi:hypothetical protein